MKKIFALLFILTLSSLCCFSQTANTQLVTVEITNVVVNGGTVYVSIFSNAQALRRQEANYSFALQPYNIVISYEITLPHGEYYIGIFQDANNNGDLDTNFLGVPRELIGISNYFGRGLPSNNFDRQKIEVDGTTEIICIGLFRL